MPAPFINQQDLTDHIGRDVTADPGALAAVDAACEIVRVIAEQNFDYATETITLDGTGTDCLLLPELPAVAAGTVLVNGGTVTDYVLADNGRLIRKTPVSGTAGTAADWFWWSWWGWPYVPVADPLSGWNFDPPHVIWPMGRQNVQVTYDHGYGTADIPRAVRMVALTLAARIVIQGAAVAETVGPVNVRYAGPAMDLTTGEKAILRKYRPTR